MPTWNYVATHLYGQFQLLTNADDVMDILSNTVNQYEAGFTEPWDLSRVSEEHVNQFVKHIVGFKIIVTHWEAAWKLHQDYTPETVKGVIQALEQLDDDNSKKLAHLMRLNNA